MKNTILFLMITLCTEIWSQKTFQYSHFRLNKVTTLEDIINNLDDESKLITDKNNYVRGNDIDLIDDYGNNLRLGFLNKTYIVDFLNITKVKNINSIKSMIFNQLGEPGFGYEILEQRFPKVSDNIKNSQYFPKFEGLHNHSGYHCYYQYNFEDYSITFDIEIDYYTGWFEIGYNVRIYYNFGEVKTNYFPSLNDENNDMMDIKKSLVKKW